MNLPFHPPPRTIASVLLLATLAGAASASHQKSPLENEYDLKLAELNKKDTYVQKLLHQLQQQAPDIAKHGTQVHMGFWSGMGMDGVNRQGLRSLIDLFDRASQHKVVWDEGTGQGVLANDADLPEYKAIDDLSNRLYAAKHADLSNHLWAVFSERYTEVAELIEKATGKKIKAWCFVYDAQPNRIFRTAELPVLEKLEQQNLVDVYSLGKDVVVELEDVKKKNGTLQPLQLAPLMMKVLEDDLLRVSGVKGSQQTEPHSPTSSPRSKQRWNKGTKNIVYQ